MRNKNTENKKRLPNYLLSIDATHLELTGLFLVSKDFSAQHQFVSKKLSERLMPEIKIFLQKRKLIFNQIKRIEVKRGPGSFSRIRTAVATANALAYGLGLSQKMIRPIYDKALNITFPKRNA